jgi:two-component sensor histidine kinase
VNLEAALNPVHPRLSATEFRLKRRNGEVRWVETLGLAYFEGGGRERRAVSFVGTLQDITDRKEREEKERLLMLEINHRAKNMLSVVHAIARQTATKNSEDFIARFSERIQALSANQDLLVRNEWNGVEVADLVHAQLAPFVGLLGSRIAVHGPRLRLTASSAQAVGLELHELATNAGKYGALSNDRGCVDVGWGVSGESFSMHWTESGGPPVPPPKRRGFGSIVMDVMAERSLGGKVDLDYAPSGVTWRLTCPTANALEPGEPDEKGEPDGSGGGPDGIGRGPARPPVRRRENGRQSAAPAVSVQHRVARPVAAFVIAHENLCDLRVPQRLTGVVGQQVLFRHIRHVFRLRIFGEQMIIRLILVRADLGGYRLIPFLSIAEERVDIEYDAPEWINPVPHDLPDGVFRVSNFIHVRYPWNATLVMDCGVLSPFW